MTAVARVLTPYVLGVCGVAAWQWAFEHLPLAVSMLALLLAAALLCTWVVVTSSREDRRLGGRGQAGLLAHAIDTGDVRRSADVATWRARVPAMSARARADADAAVWMWLPAAASAAALAAVALLGDPRTALGQALVPVLLLAMWLLQRRSLRRRAAGLEQVLARVTAPAPAVPATR